MPHLLKFHSIDSGFCRVYFQLKGSLSLFCIQEDFKDCFEFYNCSSDGEPIAPFKIKKELTIEIEYPKKDCFKFELIKNFIDSHPQLKGV